MIEEDQNGHDPRRARLRHPGEGDAEVIDDGAVLIVGDRIAAVGTTRELRALTTPVDSVIDATGQAVIPGFVDTHAHLVGGLNKGLTEDPPAGASGFFNVAIPLHDHYVMEADLYPVSLSHGVELLRSGVTCVNENWWPQDETARSLVDLGLRAVVGPMIRETEFGQMSPNVITREWDKELGKRTFDAAVSAIETWNGAGKGRITCAVAPCSPDTCSEEMLLACRELAETLDLGYHVHLADNPGTHLYTQQAFGKTPVEFLDSLGYLNERFVGAHSVFLSSSDVEIMARTRAHISHTAFLVGKRAYFPPMPEIYERGVSVSLGTDWGSCDLFKTMRSAILVARNQAQRPDVVGAKEMLTIATLGGAHALGLEAEIGSLVPGKKADITIVDMTTPWCVPLRLPNLITNLVFNANASDVSHVIIDGELLVEDGRLTRFDERELLRLGQSAADRVWSRASSVLSVFD